MRKRSNRKAAKTRVEGILGLGLDATDGQKRITRTEEMVLVGGSRETHEQMQETAVRFSEALEQRGKRLGDVSVAEAIDLLRDAHRRSS